MRTTVLLSSLVLLVTVAIYSSWLSTLIRGRRSEPEVISQLDALIRHEVEDKRLPALSIALVDRQDVVWEAGYGLADPVQDEPATPHTIYLFPAAARFLTAVSILRQVERGYLNLDAPVARYVQDFQPNNPYGFPVTLRQLLTHHAGLVRESPLGNSFDTVSVSLNHTVLSLNQTHLIYPPETIAKYSDAGYQTAGLVLEQLFEQPFERHQRAVLDRFELRKTSYTPRFDLLGRLAQGHEWTYDLRQYPVSTGPLDIDPSSNLYSSVHEMARMVGLLFAKTDAGDASLLNRESRRSLWQVQFPRPENPDGYGLGTYVMDQDGEPLVVMTDARRGYTTGLYMLPQREFGIVIATTLDPANAAIDRIASYAFDALIALRARRSLDPFVYPIPVPIQRRHEWVGTYIGPDTLRLATLGDELYLYRHKDRYRLRLLNDTLIVDDPRLIGPMFVRRSDSLLTQNDLYRRVPDRPLAAAPPLAYQSGLLGTYGTETQQIEILYEDNTLYAQVNRFHFYPLRERSAHTYAFPDYGHYAGETLTFQLDENGVASSLHLMRIPMVRRPSLPPGEPIFAEPDRPVESLLAEARTAVPPDDPPASLTSDLVDLTLLDPLLNLDIRFATPGNLLGAPVYDEHRAFLQRPAAEALIRVQERLNRMGYGLTIYDAYRPWFISKMLWDAAPDSLRTYLSDPSEGSPQNRGCTVELGLYDLATGRPVPMPSRYLESSPRARAEYQGGTPEELFHRDLLRRYMQDEGFSVQPEAWWRFEYKDWTAYPILNIPFTDVVADQPGIYESE